MKFDWWRLLPLYWLQNYPTSWSWDASLKKALHLQNSVSNITEYTCEVGPFKVWIENWPYAFGSRVGFPDYLPSVSTRRLLRQRLEEAIAYDRESQK